MPSDVLAPLPPEAADLAQLIRVGNNVAAAVETLCIDPAIALTWLRHPDWEDLLTDERSVNSMIRSQKASLVGKALEVKTDILSDDSFDPKLRDKVASEILDSFAPPTRTVERTVFVIEKAEAQLVGLTLKELVGETIDVSVHSSEEEEL